MPGREPAVLLTCEHGGRRVPARWEPLFRGAGKLLGSHRGWDLGSAELGRALARRHGWELIVATTTRLLVDLNRSEGSPTLFSSRTRRLPRAERHRLLRELYHPHRDRVVGAVRAGIALRGRVVHVGVHTFTPVWNGRRRRVEIGLLHDPAAPAERALVERWLPELRAVLPDLRVVRNRPYRGWTDGLVNHLRGRFPAESYAGIELEVSRGLAEGPRPRWRALQRTLGDTLASALRQGR